MRRSVLTLVVAFASAAMWAACGTSTTDGAAGMGGSVEKGGASNGGSSHGGTSNGGSSDGGSSNGGSGGSSHKGGAGASSTGGQGYGGAGGSTVGNGGSPECTTITAADFIADNKEHLAFASFTPNIGASEPDELNIILYDTSTYTQAPGTFDLGTGSEANFATCAHCVLAFQDASASLSDKVFFQQSGQMEIFSVTSPPTGEFAGKLTGVKLVEVTINQTTFESTPIENGACLIVADTSFNSGPTVTDGGTTDGATPEAGGP